MGLRQASWPGKRKFISRFRAAADRARGERDWAKAARLYEEYLDYRPDDTGIRIQAGHMRKEHGDLAEAERHYLLARAALPEDADLALQLGHFYKIVGRPVDALAAYRRALELAPESDDARTGHLEVSQQLGVHGLAAAPGGAREQDDATAAIRAAVAAITAQDIADSGLFDAAWYRKSYPDLNRPDIDPLRHFFEHGRNEGRRPGPGFETDWYVATYPEVVELDLEPVAHYLAVGRKQGLRPAGPAVYERWVAAFDTLTDEDGRQIDAHIRAVAPPRPVVVLHVDAANEHLLVRALRGLREQRLAPAGVHVCLAADASPGCELQVAAVGKNGMFRVLRHGSRPERGAAAETAPLVLVDAGAELREHALYLLALARMSGVMLAYGDHDRIDAEGRRVDPAFKPDASPMLMAQVNYVGPLALLPPDIGLEEVTRRLLDDRASPTEIVRDAFLAQDRRTIGHVPHVLAHEHMTRAAASLALPCPTLAELPVVSVIIPTRNKVELLGVCVETLIANTDYPADRLEVVIIDNGSDEPATIDYLAEGDGVRFRVVRDGSPFNFAKLNNRGVEVARGDVLVLLNNDTEVEDPAWLRRLVAVAMIPDVGAVGPKLLYEDGTIQHAGVVLGIGVAAAHAHVGVESDAAGAFGLAQRTHEVAAVTGACLAMRRTVYDEIGGLDEDLAVAFNDVDLCLAALSRGYRNIYVHDTWLRHFESKSRGVDDTPAKVDIYIGEANYARRKHRALFAEDPYYNPNLSKLLDAFYEPAFPPRVTYPWRDHARLGRTARVLLLGAPARDREDIAATMALHTNYLADRGYEVIVGTPARFAGERHPFVQYRLAGDCRAAATLAVQADVDCVVTYTAGYADVSRLLGDRPKAVLYHQGFGMDPAGRAREGLVATRLALPAADAVLATSEEAAAELEDEATVLPPGGDHLGTWTQSAIAAREQVRAANDWSGKLVILVETAPAGADSAETRLQQEVATALNLRDVVLIEVPGKTLPGPFRTVAHLDMVALMSAADIFWPAKPGSALMAAVAASFGLQVVRRANEAQVTAREALMLGLNHAADAAASTSIMLRRPNGPSWAGSLARFEAILCDAAGLDRPPPRPARSLIAAQPLVEASGLFDAGAYLRFNPDVAAAKIDPWQHFSEHGSVEGRRASYLFDTRWYLARYPEVAAARLSPMGHYLSLPEGDFDPNPYFDNRHYLTTYPDVAASGFAPLVHYLRFGASEGRSIGEGFDADFYARVHPDVAASGLLPFVHFMQVGDAEGRLALRPELAPVDLFDDAALAAFLDRPVAEIVPAATARIFDRPTAARYVVTLLRSRPDLRARFPDVISGGADGAFAQWLAAEGGDELGLSPRDVRLIGALLASDFAARVRQHYLVRTELRRLLPFGLLPEGAGGLLRWGVDEAASADGIAREEIWWLLLLSAEQPEAALWLTYAFTPAWQRAHPAAQTPSGATAFRDWLHDEFGVAARYGGPEADPSVTPADAIRIAYNADPALREAHPRAFDTAATAAALVASLCDAAPAGKGWLDRINHGTVTGELTAPGVNLIGHFCYPSGLKTSTEALVRGCHEVGLRTALRDIWVQLPGDENHHADYRDMELYDTTIMLCQPEPLFDTAYQRAGLAPRRVPPYRIGYWYWEQDEIPDIWVEKARHVDEVWTSTSFVGDALRKKLDIPVQVIPHGIELLPFAPRSRAHFGLPQDHFLFLFTFHMMSVMERKNPLGLIEAFVREFRPEEKVSLVLKTSFGEHHPDQIAELRRAAAGANVVIIDSVYTKEDVLALMDACDAYVSLHRSEGYGLTMAEAMLVGKPTIATGYSANLDFMSPENSILVDYALVTLDREYPPYAKGSRWAHASIEHASRSMRRLVDDPDGARALGAKAKADLEARMSFVASGRMIAARLAEIDAMRRAGKVPG